MLVSTLVPLALVLALGAVAVAVVRARHRRNVGESRDAPCPPPSNPCGTGDRRGEGGLPCFLLFHKLKKRFWESRVQKDKHTGAPNLHEVLLSKCCLWKATPTAQVQVQRQSR